MHKLSDIAGMNTGVQTKANSRKARIQYRFDSLWPIRDQLTSWQADFLLSTKIQFEDKGDLSDAQFKVLLSIWQDAHHENLVSLPKGMV